MENSSKEARAKRLKQARKLRYEHAVEAAAALGLSEQTYLPYENARTGYAHRVVRFADFFKVNERWLLSGAGPMKRGEPHRVAELFEQIPPDKQPYVLEMIELYAGRKT